MYKARNTGTGNGMRGTREMGGILYSGECLQTFCEMLPNIPGEYSQTVRGNLLKHSGGMSPSIPGNVTKHSGDFHQTFQGMSPNIIGNFLNGECPQYRSSPNTV